MSPSGGGPVLIAGATGFIGRHLVKALVGRGTQVVALSRRPGRWSNPLVENRVADVTRAETLHGAAKGCLSIVHLVGVDRTIERRAPGASQTAREDAEVAGARHLLAEAARAGVQRFLYVSSVKAGAEESPVALREEEVPRPTTEYGRAKLEAEALMLDHAARTGAVVGILRPPMVYGRDGGANFHRLAALARAGVPLPFGRLDNRRSVVYVENLVQAILVALDNNRIAGRVFYVADGDPVSTPDLVRMQAAAVGKRVRLVPCPVMALRALASIADRLGRALPLPVSGLDIARLTENLAVDDSRIRRECGYRPPYTTSVAVGLALG